MRFLSMIIIDIGQGMRKFDEDELNFGVFRQLSFYPLAGKRFEKAGLFRFAAIAGPMFPSPCGEKV